MGLSDVSLVGGKNASLGEMIGALSKKGIRIPDGFAVTATAYWYFIDYNNLRDRMQQIMSTLTDMSDTTRLQQVGKQIRALIEKGMMPPDLADQIKQAYINLSEQYGKKEIDALYAAKLVDENMVKEFLINRIKQDDNFAKRCIALLNADALLENNLIDLYNKLNIQSD